MAREAVECCNCGEWPEVEAEKWCDCDYGDCTDECWCVADPDQKCPECGELMYRGGGTSDAEDRAEERRQMGFDF